MPDFVNCDFFALEGSKARCFDADVNNSKLRQGAGMKKVALALALVVAGLSLGGCFVGKGKAPAPVVTKG